MLRKRPHRYNVEERGSTSAYASRRIKFLQSTGNQGTLIFHFSLLCNDRNWEEKVTAFYRAMMHFMFFTKIWERDVLVIFISALEFNTTSKYQVFIYLWPILKQKGQSKNVK
mmetsp:Transcript_27338/g.40220  ORF Transcript_27338/g.40220 Transcript_27338/m.40220 type:complete len:112 (+) Transcript_27338:398-733(+)